jgi:endo-1,4-beta-xylanase
LFHQVSRWRPRHPTVNFADLDFAHSFAAANELPFHLHTLVWGQQQPAWVASLPPAEQLEELEEWLAELALRYDNIATIDVVNEPLHAVPSHAEALGGAGETGFDWVIRAFELARQYFPTSELLNEYQVLSQSDFAGQYFALVQLLQERELVDGIGVQGHFLERVPAEDVAANLTTLTETGLPVYSTELDVNLLNDARNAGVFSELFSVLWQNPSVLGLTHWGHAEGRTWQPNAYLINEDGTPQPALEWLLCYRGDQANCTVPEYIPQPWVGNAHSLTLEAELWDEASGVLALGDVAAYIDNGDWLAWYRSRSPPGRCTMYRCF